MDFFQHQDQARKASRRLLVYFVLAVAAIVLSVHLAVSFLFFWVQSRPDAAFAWWDLDRLLALAGGTLLIIAAGSLYKLWRLSEGGATVARLLGGRPIAPNTTDPHERRVLNVVEEMAIASGLPVPSVYLLEREDGINAFAAGFAPEDAVIAVTRGTMRMLSRDELQGVIAHELSHILHGDVRLNLRLMGVLHGILVIALLGYFILRSSLRAASSRRKGGAAAALPLLGVLLVAIGYVGVFFGRIIKSAVSRQREFLADAAAVQFTRNPLGVAGALKKIGALTEGSLVMSPHAEQASHFFFSDAKLGKVRAALAGVTHFDFLSTHPPLSERIRRIDPRWDGAFPKVELPPVEESRVSEPGPRTPREVLPLQLVALAGALDQEHLAQARSLLARIPERVLAAVHEPSGARAAVLALLADGDPSIGETQLSFVRAAGDEALEKEIRELARLLETAPRETRLPLLDLAVPSLRRLSAAQFEAFMSLVDRFIRADRQIDLFEYALTHVLKRQLEPAFRPSRRPAIAYYALPPLRNECSALLSAVAYSGNPDSSAAERAFARGAGELKGLSLSLLARDRAGLAAVRDALEKLERLAPRFKRDLMRALVATVTEDGRIRAGEGEVLRAIAEGLGIPMPPLLPGQELAAGPRPVLTATSPSA